MEEGGGGGAKTYDGEKAYTVKKSFVSFPSPAGMSLPNSPWAGIMSNDVITELFLPSRGSLVSEIPAGDGKLENLFLRCSPL